MADPEHPWYYSPGDAVRALMDWTQRDKPWVTADDLALGVKRPELPPRPEALGGPKPGPSIGPGRPRPVTDRTLRAPNLFGHRPLPPAEVENFGTPATLDQLAMGLSNSPLGWLDPDMLATKAVTALPGMYSKLDRLVEDLMKKSPQTLPGKIWSGTSGVPGLKSVNPEELAYRGLGPGPAVQGWVKGTPEFLSKGRNPNAPMQVKELQDYLSSRPAPWPTILDLSETAAPRANVSSSYPNNQYRFLLGPPEHSSSSYFGGGQYATPGGRNYHETLYRLPPPERAPIEAELDRLKQQYGDQLGPVLRQAGASDALAQAEIERLFGTQGMHLPADQLRAQLTHFTPYIGPHYGFPDVTGWARHNEYYLPDLGWGRLIQEVQGDPYQIGRRPIGGKPGFRLSPGEAARELADLTPQREAAWETRNEARRQADDLEQTIEDTLHALTRSYLPSSYSHLEYRPSYYDTEARQAWDAARDAAEGDTRYLNAQASHEIGQGRRTAADAAHRELIDRERFLERHSDPRELRSIPPRFPHEEHWPRLFLGHQYQDALRMPPVERRPGEGPTQLNWLGLLQGDTMLQDRAADAYNRTFYERNLVDTINKLTGEGLKGSNVPAPMMETLKGYPAPGQMGPAQFPRTVPGTNRRLSVVNFDPVREKLIENMFYLMGLGGLAAGAGAASQVGQPPPVRLAPSHEQER